MLHVYIQLSHWIVSCGSLIKSFNLEESSYKEYNIVVRFESNEGIIVAVLVDDHQPQRRRRRVVRHNNQASVKNVEVSTFITRIK